MAVTKRRRQAQANRAVHVLVSQLSWVTAPLRFSETAGRLVYRTRCGDVTADARNLALAQRRLYKMRQIGDAASIVLGMESSTWIAERSSKLELAKKVRAVNERFQKMHTGAGAALMPPDAELIDLLVVESICQDRLPVTATAFLLEGGQKCLPILSEIVASPSSIRVKGQASAYPAITRALASLISGAISRGSPHHESIARSNWLLRCFKFGSRFGATDAPVLCVMLLKGSEDCGTIAELFKKWGRLAHFKPPAAVLLEVVSGRESAEREALTTLANTLHSLERLDRVGKHLMQYRQSIPPGNLNYRKGMAARMEKHRLMFIEQVKAIALRYLEVDRHPQSLESIADLLEKMAELLGGIAFTHSDVLLKVLRAGLSDRHVAPSGYLSLVTEAADQFKTRLKRRAEAKPSARQESFDQWFVASWKEDVRCILKLLKQIDDLELCRRVIRAGLALQVCGSCYKLDREYCRLYLNIRDRLQLKDMYDDRVLYETLVAFGSAEEAARHLNPLVEALLTEALPGHHFIEALDVIPLRRSDLIEALPIMSRLAPEIVAALKDSDYCICAPVFDGSLYIHREIPCPEPDFKWFLNFVNANKPFDYDLQRKFDRGLQCAKALSSGDGGRFKAIMKAAVRVMMFRTHESHELFRDGLAIVTKMPWLHEDLANMIEIRPMRVLHLIEHIALAQRIEGGINIAAEKMRQSIQPCHDVAYWKRHCPELPQLIAGYPAMTELACSFVQAKCSSAGSDVECRLPASVTKLLHQEEKMARELTYLQAIVSSRYHNRPAIEKRMSNLKSRIENAELVKNRVEAEMKKLLKRAVTEARLEAFEEALRCAFRKHARRIAEAGFCEDTKLDNYLFNAVLLSMEITNNRNLLRKLIRAHLSGDSVWREREPQNMRFLSAMAKQGIAVEKWLSRFCRTYNNKDLPGGSVTLYLEHEPIKILQMGNIFDTCLSFNGYHSYSVVANASDLNKRVIYAEDNRRRIVGRKLIGINEAYHLIGYQTYTSLPDARSNEVLRLIFDRFGAEFALHCGLNRSDEGSIPGLITRHWYDDGIEAWQRLPAQDDAQKDGNAAAD